MQKFIKIQRLVPLLEYFHITAAQFTKWGERLLLHCAYNPALVPSSYPSPLHGIFLQFLWLGVDGWEQLKLESWRTIFPHYLGRNRKQRVGRAQSASRILNLLQNLHKSLEESRRGKKKTSGTWQPPSDKQYTSGNDVIISAICVAYSIPISPYFAGYLPSRDRCLPCLL